MKEIIFLLEDTCIDFKNLCSFTSCDLKVVFQNDSKDNALVQNLQFK